MPDPIKPTAADYEQAAAETNRLQRELDITNADHIALWLEVNTIPDEPMDQCISWLACRIVEAHEAAAQQAREQALEEAIDAQPSTAENPNEDAYQRGRFDGIMEFAKALQALKEQRPC